MAVLEKRQFIARQVRARLTLEPETSDLLQEFATTEHGTKRKLYDKLRAIALDNDLRVTAPIGACCLGHRR